VKRDTAILAIALALISSSGAPVRADSSDAIAGRAAPSDPLFDDDFDHEDEDGFSSISDPLEETNRDVLVANRFFDRFLLDPLTFAYSKAVPGPLKLGIRNAFANLDSPKVVVNDVLQLEWEDASVATTRLVVNSTLGLGGLFDVGERIGLPGHDSDFGQTLALAGTPRGAYLVLPVLGPNNVRDTVGGAVDVAMRPVTYLFAPALIFYYGGGMGLVKREEAFQALNDLESSSIDFYSTLRSAYDQHRTEAVWGRRQHRLDDAGEAGREIRR
jgi:phospholipid-binding lipoprotein MlaA